jgi:hypothetical protein
MIPTLLASGILLYGIIQLIVALIAVYLAIKWNKYQFLPGLFFLLLYAIIEVIDLFFFTVVQGVFIDVAQFGFILLSIIFFIVGMHPSWAHKLEFARKVQKNEQKSLRNESAISILKKF